MEIPAETYEQLIRERVNGPGFLNGDRVTFVMFAPSVRSMV